MSFSSSMYLAVFLATAASATRMQLPAVIGEADIGQKAFLGKAATTHGCGADPNCGEQVSMVLVVNNGLQEAQEVEKKAEKQETAAKNLVEAVNEVKASAKAESGARADELAAKEKVEIAHAQVKNEVSEIKAKEQAVEAEEQEAKKITDPAAKAVVKKDESEMEAEVKEEKIEADVAKEKEESTKQAEQVVAMEAIAAKADEEAKEQKFTSEAKSVKQVEKQSDPKAIYKVEMKLYKLQTQVVKDAAKTTDAKPTAVEQIKAAEVPKVQMAVQIINKAKVDAADAKVEEKKALTLFKEVELEEKTEEQVDMVMNDFGSVKELDEAMKKCEGCLVKHKAAGTVPEPVKLVNILGFTNIKMVEGGDWIDVTCDAGSKMIGGGCDAKKSPHRMQFSGPGQVNGKPSWKCGGHGGPKNAFAICSSGPPAEKACNYQCYLDRYPDLQKAFGATNVGEAAKHWTRHGKGEKRDCTCFSGLTPNSVFKDGGDWTKVECPEGQKVISGGCDAKAHPFIMQYNGPAGDKAWQCGGHGGPKRVWAFCSGVAKTVIKRVDGGDWTKAMCDAGKKVVGGGCDAKVHPYIMQMNAPIEGGWQCGGHGGAKTAWAICEA